MDILAHRPHQQPHVVVVGAGFAGLGAAKVLRRANVDVTILDRHNHHLFQPLLYQVATAALSPGDISYPIRAIFSKDKNVRTLLAQADGFDLHNKRVRLQSGELAYDYLIVASGATHSYFGHDDWAKDAPGLKELQDALDIRRRIFIAFERAERESDPAKREALLTFVIVGGGPTGVELAGAIAEIAKQVMVEDFREIDPTDTRIILVEAGPRILASMPENLSAKAEADLRRLGCWVWTNKMVTEVTADHVCVGEETVPACTTLWAAGVQASGLGRALTDQTDRSGRAPVEIDLSLPGHSEVFVAGDLAHFAHNRERPLPGVAPVAMQQGKHAAKNILRLIAGEKTEPFEYFDKGNLATIGRAAAVAHIGKLKLSGLIAWLAWLFVHVLYLVGFRNRTAVIFNWAWSYVQTKRAARIIYGYPPA